MPCATSSIVRQRRRRSFFEEDTDEEEQESICRGWRFVQHFKSRYRPEFLLGWDIGRAAMLARWGCYLGWITEGEAVGILWELSQKAVQELHSWREFARSYIFGGLMWSLSAATARRRAILAIWQMPQPIFLPEALRRRKDNGGNAHGRKPAELGSVCNSLFGGFQKNIFNQR